MWRELHHLYNGSSGTFLPVKEGTDAMATVKFDQATRIYPGNDSPSVDRLDIDVADGEFLVLVGPSGCGKSTSLRMLAGLEEVNGGKIWIGDRDVTDLSPKDRDVAMVFQNYALYPHMTVADNMGFALKIAGVDKSEIKKRVAEAAQILDLTDYLERKPKALSGGQRQRVAMGRAIVRSPQVFLMDEPLSNLDAKLRVQTRTQIASLQRRLGVTTVYVTHDQIEAMTMGDRIALLKDGILQQCATPREMYDRPNNVFVAGFIGSPAMNLVSVPVTEDGVQFGSHRLPVDRALLGKVGNQVIGAHAPRGRRGHDQRGRPRADRRRRRGARRRRLRLRHPGQRQREARGRRRRSRQAVHRAGRRPKGPRQGLEDLRLPQRRAHARVRPRERCASRLTPNRCSTRRPGPHRSGRRGIHGRMSVRPRPS